MTRPAGPASVPMAVAPLLSAVALLVLPSAAEAQKDKPKIKLPESVRYEADVSMQVASVIVSRRDEVAQAADEIDRLVEDQLILNDLRPNRLASDEVFLRRVYLDVAGRIPTLKEARRFLESEDPQRRQMLIDRLLSSPGYVSNLYNLWADTLRLVDRPQTNVIATPFLAYVKDAIRTNKPYDQWVYEMLTADGKVWENPAVGYQLRDQGMPLAYVDNTVRVFLGTQLGCAQCHDHPFDEWTQLQFYQLAALTHGTQTRIRRGDPGFEKQNPASRLIREARERAEDGRVPGQFQRLARANTYIVSERPRKLRLPHDYAYPDAKPKQVVEPAVLWGEVPSAAAEGSGREKFAAWLTSAENERFSQTIVNRLWKRLMGVGLVEPVDDFRYDNPPVNERLMDYLCEELVRQDFNIKEFLRMVLYSETYQRAASDYDVTSGQPYHFPGPTVRRMTAEQVWDSILTLAVNNPWPFQRPTAEEMAPVVNLDFTSADYQSVKEQSEEFGETYFLRAYKRSLKKHEYEGNVLCRASELPSPAPAGHFLRQFGQGDRETIGGRNRDATVPQILAMFNGPITHVMLEPGSATVDNVLAIEKTRDRIDAIFLSVLARLPDSEDRRLCASELTHYRDDAIAYGNIIWALLNTREFLFVQ